MFKNSKFEISNASAEMVMGYIINKVNLLQIVSLYLVELSV